MNTNNRTPFVISIKEKSRVAVRVGMQILVILLCFQTCRTSAADYDYRVDVGRVVGANTRFWQAAGHDYLFKLVNEPEGQALLDRLAQDQSCRYFRTHYTFNNTTGEDKQAGGPIGGKVVMLDSNGKPIYDFSTVDKTFSEYVRRGMKPIVEMDLFPDGFGRPLTKEANSEGFSGAVGVPNDWNQWHDLLKRFMQELVDKFGKEEVRTWYFEVWNEPDAWPRDHLDVFFRLYDEFAAVVKSFDPEFKVGGPGCYNESFLTVFLDHVTNGTNYITGGKGAPIDFISYHIYGLSGRWLNKPPHIVPEVQRFTIQLLWLQRIIRQEKLDMDKTEFLLDEWGQCSNFGRTSAKYPDLQYRDDERAPLFMAKLVDCLYALEDDDNFKTSLMLFWGFCGESQQNRLFIGNRDLTTAGNIPKPILTGYTMLAKLGDQRVAVAGPAAGDRTGLIATSSGKNQYQVLLYNFCETDDELDRADEIQVTLNGLSGEKLKLTYYDLDREHNNTFRAWERAGRPSTIERADKDLLMKTGKLTATGGQMVAITNGVATLKASLPRHSMRLYLAETLLPTGRTASH